MFSIFMPTKLSDQKTETMEELMQKLNNATKQLCDPLLSVEDREQLYNVINYCASHINTFTTQKAESEQLATAPNPDDLLADAASEPAEPTNLDQYLSFVQDPPNLAMNLDYHSNAPSPGTVLQAPFCSPTPYQSMHLGSSKPQNVTQGETVFDESNLCPGAVDEWIVGTVLISHQSHTTFDDKKKRQFYDNFVAGLP